ncbi:MAG: protein kinase domain-containing protein [Gemmataceae bacterium]
MAHDSPPSTSGAETPHLPPTLMTCPNGHLVPAGETICPHCGTLAATESLPMGPNLPSVSGYEILGVLGRGGMGVVYKARQLSLDHVVALKMIRDDGFAWAEAQAIARLQHPQVVQVFEVGEHQGQPFFSLELVSGGSLAEKLRGLPQPPHPAALLVETLARAVHAAHQQGIVHRDNLPLRALVGKRPEAIRALQRSCDLGEQLLEQNSHPRLPLSLAEQYAQLGVFQAALGQRDDALASGQRGLELLDRLTAQDKKDFGDPKSLAVTCFLLGALLMDLRQFEEAARAYQQAIEYQRVVLEQDPSDRTRRKVLSHFYYNLAHVQLQAGRVVESAATALERRKLWPNDADEVHDVACELARCAAVIAPGKLDSELSPEEQKQRRAYADQAMMVLRQAVQLGLKGAAAVRRTADLKPLRDRDDFRLSGGGITADEVWVANRAGFDPKPYNQATLDNLPKGHQGTHLRWMLSGPDVSVVAETEKISGEIFLSKWRRPGTIRG